MRTRASRLLSLVLSVALCLSLAVTAGAYLGNFSLDFFPLAGDRYFYGILCLHFLQILSLKTSFYL